MDDSFYGTYYYEANGHYLYYTFNKDKTGKYEFINKYGDLVSYAEFTYSFSVGNQIKAKGYKVNTDVSVDYNRTAIFDYKSGILVSGDQEYRKLY